MSSLVDYELLKDKKCLIFIFAASSTGLVTQQRLVKKQISQKHEWFGTKTPTFNLIYKKNSFTCVPKALCVTSFCSKYHICFEFVLYLCMGL